MREKLRALDPDSGDVRPFNFDRDSMRRQVRVSLLLVTATATAAFVLGYFLPISNIKTANATSLEIRELN